MRAAIPVDLLEPLRHEAKLDVGEAITLGDKQRRQLAAREINVKEAFTIVDAAGAFFRASRKADAEAVIYERMPGGTESPARITLVCAVLSRQRMLVVAQKATELGCVRFVPVLSEHSVKKADLDKEKPWAWQGQAIKACRQCRRASVPEVLGVISFEAALAAPYWKGADQRFAMDDRADADASDPFASPSAGGDYVLAVGPEGGWSDTERERLVAAGARPLALGARILRAETAVFAGLTVLQHRLGDLKRRVGRHSP
jgi:16S rRNA (uracil1498-N3)-methyltransferase